MKDACRTERDPRAFTILILLSIVVIYGIFSYLTPYVLDDIVFRNCYLKHSGGSESFSLSALVDFAREVRDYDNGRLANILSPIATMMVPRWLFALITGIGVAAMYMMMLKIASIPSKMRPYAILSVWLFSLVLLPWRNNIIVNDYLLNYLYSSLAILAFVLLLSKSAQRRLKVGQMSAAIVIALVAGWFHEGFSIPLCGAMGIYAISRRFRLPAQWWLLAIVFGLSSLFVFLSPGILSRAGRELNGQGISEKIKVLCTVLPAVLLLSGIILSAFFLPQVKRIMKCVMMRPAIFMLVFASLFAGIIVLMVNSDQRAGWPAELYAMTVLLAFIPFCHVERRKNALKVVAWLAYIAICGFFVNVLVWQHRFYRQHMEIVRLMEESRSGTAFYDIIDPRDVRKSTLFLPLRGQWVTSFQLDVINDPDIPSEKYRSVVPQCLSRYDSSAARKIDGNGRLVDFEGVLVGPDGPYRSEEERRYSDEAVYDFTADDGSVYSGVGCFRVRFKDNDGVFRMYVWPSTVRIQKKIVKADFVRFS